MKEKRALVTGGAGFIGSHLAERLTELRNNVSVIDNLSITMNNVPVLKSKDIEVIEADITSYKKIFGYFKDVDIVFHLAAMNRAVKSINEPLLANEVNITGTLNVLEASRKNNVSKVVNISSSSVYGSSKAMPRMEDSILSPTHPYGVGKLASEHYANVYNELYGIETVNLRYFSIYGPRQLGTIEHAAVIPKFIYRIMNSMPIEVYGSGEQKRNFTFVGDAVECTVKASEANNAVGETINVSTIEEVTINRLISLLESATCKKAIVKHMEEIKVEIKENPADISKAKSILGHDKWVSLKEGISNTVEWNKNEL